MAGVAWRRGWRPAKRDADGGDWSEAGPVGPPGRLPREAAASSIVRVWRVYGRWGGCWRVWGVGKHTRCGGGRCRRGGERHACPPRKNKCDDENQNTHLTHFSAGLCDSPLCPVRCVCTPPHTRAHTLSAGTLPRAHPAGHAAGRDLPGRGRADRVRVRARPARRRRRSVSHARPGPPGPGRAGARPGVPHPQAGTSPHPHDLRRGSRRPGSPTPALRPG